MIGETIKDFKLTALLGRGGMGEVYTATQQIVKTKVAIKLLRTEISSDAQHVQRFFNEAIAASKIQHAGIVKIFDVGFHDGRAYLIMEHLEGESLAARLKRPPRLSRDELVDLGVQLASVLQATHAAGITHRDLKPDNVFLVADAELASKRRVKVLDFGIAKLAPATADAASGATALTVTNASMGTPAYMAPEQWRDAASADARADVYSLGCVVFELCCGRPPFLATSLAEACNKHLNEVPPRIRSLAPELPAALEVLVAQMLEKDPAARPAIETIGARLTALRDTRDDAPAVSARSLTVAPSPGRSPRARYAAAAGALAAIALGAVILATRSHGTGARPQPMVSAGGCPAGTVRIPGGTFWMGRDTGEDSERPRHEVTVSAYCIDRTEVTVAAYAACVAKGGCAPAPTTVLTEGWSEDKTKLWSRFCNGGHADRQEHPINCINWSHASAYCSWLGERLPTEAEWEFAARGTDGRRFPWGDEPPTAAHLNACGSECRELARQSGMQWQVLYEANDGWDRTAPAGSYPEGASPFGVLDLAGNVSEWVADWSGPYPSTAQTNPAGPASGATRVIRNTGWQSPWPAEVSATSRTWEVQTARSAIVGFRCARDL